MRIRLVIAPAALLVALAVGSSSAKTAPLIEDPKGDYPVPAADILSADITTVKTGKGKLIIELVVDAAPSPTTPYSYTVSFVVGDCNFSAVYYGHPFDGVFTKTGVGCSDPSSTSLPEGNIKIDGGKLTWTVPLSGDLKKGATATEITAATQPTGMVSGGVIAMLGDEATTDKSYKIGS